MARTKQFDPNTALDTAVQVFWRLGYEHTSVEILMGEMGISKQSLYDTFGDKRAIYSKAMDRYRATTNQGLRNLLNSERSVKKAFTKIFQSMLIESKAELERGCLLLSANLSRDIGDADIKKFLRKNQREVEEIFENAFRSGQSSGEISPKKDPAALAKFFVSTIQGMRALGRLNHDREELRQISTVALAALD